MKFYILYFILFFSISSIFAQSNEAWSPIGLTASGKNMQNGVEAFYQLNKCNNESVVFIKFVNHNNYGISLEWKDAVFTKDSEWVVNKNVEVLKHLTLEGNTSVSGDCSGINQSDLVVKVTDIISNIEDFNLLGINSLKVSSIN